jgi:hypothetical protein
MQGSWMRRLWGACAAQALALGVSAFCLLAWRAAHSSGQSRVLLGSNDPA